LENAPQIGFGLYIVSAPTPFSRDEIAALKTDAPTVIGRYFPDAATLHAKHIADSTGVPDAEPTETSAVGVTVDQTKLVLRRVKDPELNLNIVDLGVICDIQVDGADINVDMSLTSQRKVHGRQSSGFQGAVVAGHGEPSRRTGEEEAPVNLPAVPLRRSAIARFI
jgi:Iron-sulfur cluster assembly protein